MSLKVAKSSRLSIRIWKSTLHLFLDKNSRSDLEGRLQSAVAQFNKP